MRTNNNAARKLRPVSPPVDLAPPERPPQRPCRFHPVRLDRDVLGGLADVERDLIRVAAPA